MVSSLKHIWSSGGGKKGNTWTFVFFKKFQDNSAMHQDFEKWFKVFLLNGSFGDTEFYYFPVDQSWYSGIELHNHNSKRCLSVFTINSQTKKNDNYNCKP